MVVDGTGAPGRRADVGVVGDRIVAIDDELEPGAARVIDATDRIVTPGFVDVHTHLDAQIAWDPLASVGTAHGITSVVVGNCGMALAPCRPVDRERLAELVETVEEIPRAAILDGVSWEWVSYGEYLDTLGRLPKGPNVGAMIGHSAVRQYVMGDRSALPAPATPDEVAEMARLVDDAMAEGALGFSTSRTLLHRDPDDVRLPGTFAEPGELYAIAEVLARHGRGVFGAASRLGEVDDTDLTVIRAEVAWMAEVSRRSGRPVSFGIIQHDARHDAYQQVLDFVREENTAGARLRPQTSARSIGLLFGIETRTPFDAAPSWQALRSVRNGGKLVAMRDQTRRCQLIAEGETVAPVVPLDQIYVLPPDGPVRYDCRPEDRLVAHADRRGVSPAAAYIELLLETGGELICLWPFLNHDLDAVRDMLDDPLVVLGLGDAGAHLDRMIEAGQPTFLLSYWVRDRGQWSIEEAVRRLTSDPAELFGLRDRGVLRPGSFADLNVIDLPRLELGHPRFVSDLPAGGGRYLHPAVGYDATIVNGAVLAEHGEPTGALPGRLLSSRG